jgi:hypothetical protein
VLELIVFDLITTIDCSGGANILRTLGIAIVIFDSRMLTSPMSAKSANSIAHWVWNIVVRIVLRFDAAIECSNGASTINHFETRFISDVWMLARPAGSAQAFFTTVIFKKEDWCTRFDNFIFPCLQFGIGNDMPAKNHKYQNSAEHG